MTVSKVTADLCTTKCIRLFIIILMPIIILSAVNLRRNRTNHKLFLITTTIAATKSIIQYIYLGNHTNCKNYFERSSKKSIYDKINNINNNSLNNNLPNETDSNINSNQNNNSLIKNKTSLNNLPYSYINENNYLINNHSKHNNTLYSNYIFKITIYISAATCIEAIPIIIKFLNNLLCWRLLQIYYSCIYYNCKIVICKRWINNILMMHGVMVTKSPSQQQRLPRKLQKEPHKLRQESGLSADENQPPRHYNYQQYLCHHHKLNIFELIKRKRFLIFVNTLPAKIIENNIMIWVSSIILNEATVATETLTVEICCDLVKLNLFLETFVTMRPASVVDLLFLRSKHVDHHHDSYNIYARLIHKQIQLQPQEKFNNYNKRHCSKHCGNMYQLINIVKISRNNSIRNIQSDREERLLVIKHKEFVILYYIFHNSEHDSDSDSNSNKKKNKKNVIKYFNISMHNINRYKSTRRTMKIYATARNICIHNNFDFTKINSRLLQPVIANAAVITIATTIKCSNVIRGRRCVYLLCNYAENARKCLLKKNFQQILLHKRKQQQHQQTQQQTHEKEDCAKLSTTTKTDERFCNYTCCLCYLICFCSSSNYCEICCSLWGQRWRWLCCCCRYCYFCYCCYHCCAFYHSFCHYYFMTIFCNCCHQQNECLKNKNNTNKDKDNKTKPEEIKEKSQTLNQKYQQQNRQHQNRNDKKRNKMHISCKKSDYIHQTQQWQRLCFFINYFKSSSVAINCLFEWLTEWQYYTRFFQTAMLYLRSFRSIATESRTIYANNDNRNIFHIINSNFYHFSMEIYNKLLNSSHLYRVYLIKMLSVIPSKRKRRRREHYHHHSLHPLSVSFKKSKYNHIRTCNIANDQQLKTNNLCKIFCNNRKRHRRRRRRRRRHISKQEQQQQQLSPHQQYLISQQPTVICNFYNSGRGSNSKYYNINSQQKLSKQIRIVKNLLVFNAFKTIIKTISLSRSTLSNQKSSTKIKTTKTTTRTKTSIKTKISSIATTTTTCICTTTVTRSSSLSTSVSSSFSILTTSIYKQRTKPNFVWLFIGLVWFEGPKLVNCSFISNNQQQQEHKHQQQKHHHQQQQTITNITTDVAVLLPVNSDNNSIASPAVVTTNNNFTKSLAADKYKNYNISSRNNKNFENATTPYKTQKRIATEKITTKKKKNSSRKNQRWQRKTQSATIKATESSTVSMEWFNVGYTMEQEHSAQSDRVRLESIKQQILSKLGLKRKPNVSHPLPTQFIWDTLYRADGISSVSNLNLHDNRSQQMLRIFTASNDLHKYVRVNNNNNNGTNKKNSMRMSSSSDILDATGNHYASYTGNFINYTNLLHYPSRSQEQHNNNKYKNYLQKIRNRSSSSGRKYSGDNKLTYLTNYINEFGSKNNDYDETNNLPGMQQLIPEKDVLESEDFVGSTQEIITFAEKGNMYKQHILVEFSPQTNEVSNQILYIHNAEIHIRIERSTFNDISEKILTSNGRNRNYHGKAKLKIWIFQLVGKNYTQKGFDQATRFCASFSIDTLRLGWQKFDLTNAVKHWYTQSRTDKFRLLIDCTGCGQHYVLQLFNKPNENRRKIQHHKQAQKEKHEVNPQQGRHQYEDETHLNPNRPFLVLHTETKRVRRVRRRAIDCIGAIHSQCCKESFYVSFKALGWDDWIIAPRGYFANYCRGDCTGPFRTPDSFQTFHAHFIEEYRKMGLLNGMQPCCAPIKFSSMSLIYYGDDGIIKRDLPKMVVDECGCP